MFLGIRNVFAVIKGSVLLGSGSRLADAIESVSVEFWALGWYV